MGVRRETSGETAIFTFSGAVYSVEKRICES